MKRLFIALTALAFVGTLVFGTSTNNTIKADKEQDEAIDQQLIDKPPIIGESEELNDELQDELKDPLPSVEGFAEGANSTAKPRGDKSNNRQKMDFSKLKKKNPNVVAWITIDKTPIDYAIVQAQDNETYIEKDVNLKPNKNGAIFLDYRVRSDFSGFNNILYGHNMRSGRMFACLNTFVLNEKYWNSHKTGRLYTPEETYDLKIFSALVISEYSPLYAYGFVSINQKEEFLSQIFGASTFSRDVGVTASDRVLMLSTCATGKKDDRAVIFAKLVPVGSRSADQ